MSKRVALLTIIFCFLHQSAFANNPIKIYKDYDKFFKQYTAGHEIKVMSMNAYNLYDTEHDEGFFDFTYLPIDHPMKKEKCETISHGHYKKLCFNLDWTYDRLYQKIGQLGKVIKGHGSIPDILALQEIENENVIAQLAKHTGYDHYVVTTQKNRRGVDLALLYKTDNLRFINQDEVRSPARSVLRVHFKTKSSNKDLFVYVNHWIAQSAPTLYRTKTAKALYDDINELHEEYDDPSIIMVGDFNTRFDEEEEVFNQTILNEKWKHHLVEAHTLSLKKYPKHAEHFPEGSYWRGKNYWQRFDRIFMSHNLVNGSQKLRADLESYRLIYSTEITGEYTFKEEDKDNGREMVVRYPLKYNFLEDPKYPVGFTDHLPASIILKN